jgi:hypothetical protein
LEFDAGTPEPAVLEQRSQPRHEVTSLEYITLAAGNGGIVVDVSDGGVRIQTVAPLQPSATVEFSIVGPHLGVPVEGLASVVWVTNEGQAGLRFAKLSDASRRDIKEWILAICSEQASAEGTTAEPTPTPMVMQSDIELSTPAPVKFDESAHTSGFRGEVDPKMPSTYGPLETGSASRGTDPLGPFPLSRTSIEACVRQKSWAVYLVGRFESNRFLVMRVGRSADLADELHDYIGEYEGFKFNYHATEKRAFHQECELYHHMRPIDNKSHPRKPNEADWNCPVCRGFW